MFPNDEMTNDMMGVTCINSIMVMVTTLRCINAGYVSMGLKFYNDTSFTYDVLMKSNQAITYLHKYMGSAMIVVPL